MLNFVLLSDIHLISANPICRNDNLMDLQWKKLREVFRWAKHHGATILIAGDIFNVGRGWYTFFGLMDLLLAYPEVKVFAVAGQHDHIYRNLEGSNFDALQKTGLINVIGRAPTDFVDEEDRLIVDVYGAGWKSTVPEPIQRSRKEVGGFWVCNFLVLHDPLSDTAMPFETSSAQAFLRRHKDYLLIHCGDIHRHFSVIDGPRTIMNPGPLLRRTSEEYNLTHTPGFFSFMISRDDQGQILFHKHFHEVSHPLAEEVISRDHLSQADEDQLRYRFSDAFVSKVREMKESSEFDPFSMIEAIIAESKEPERFTPRVVDILVDVISRHQPER